MEDISPVTSPASVLCNACYKHVADTDAFCDNCGYPLKGSETDQNNFISVRNSKEIDLTEANKKIKNAGFSLYYIAGATVLTGLLFYFTNTGDSAAKSDLLIVNLVLAMIYTALGAWSQKKPLAAIISGFALYLIVFLLNAVTSPETIASGIILKILFVTYFIRGIKSAIDAEKIKKELNIE